MEQIGKKKELRILMLEDTPSDAELIEHEIRKAGISFISKRVSRREAFVHALDEFHPDIVLSDYQLTDFDGMAALEIVRSTHPEVPVVMVTGALADVEAVDLIHAGAKDYVLKDRLARLAPAVQGALSAEEGIRARKQAENNLKLFRTLLDNSNDAIEVIDPVSLRLLDFNETECLDLGYSREELLSMSIRDIDHGFNENHNKTLMAQLRQSGDARFESVHRRKDGSTFPVEIGAKFIEFDQPYLLCVVRDITERKREEEALYEAQQVFRALAENSPDIIARYDCDCRRTYVNPAYLKVAQIPEQELLAAAPAQRSPLPASSAVVLQDLLHRVLDSGIADAIDVIWPKPDGIDYWYNIFAFPELDREGHVVSVMTVSRDITERKQTEQSLRNANRAMHTLSACNEALVRAGYETELLDAICRLVVETGGYRMAWVGFPEQDAERTVRPVASYGHDEGFLAGAKVSWADTEFGRGPTGMAIRTGAVQANQNFLTNPAMAPWREAAQQRGYQSSIALPLKSSTGTLGSLTIYASEPDAFNETEITLLQELAADLAFGIETLRTRAERDRIVFEHQHDEEKLRQSLEQSIQAIADTVETRDPYTAGHQRRVAELATAIAREMGLVEEKIHGIRLAASIHDLGKIQVPAEILAKPGKLTDIEYMLIKVHPEAGYDILKDIEFPWPIADMVRQHHERLDGSGYPQGLKDGQILPEARILTVADVVEAMSSHRPYRPGLGIEAALEEIERQRGVQYDAEAVDACIKLFRERGYKLPV